MSSRFFHKTFKVAIKSIKDFIKDKGFEKSATLTFYSLLSIVPLLAIIFGVAQPLGLEERLAAWIKDAFSSQPEVAEKIIEFSNANLRQTKGSIIASFGVLILLWTVFRTISNVGSFFDEIWKVKQTRTFWQQVKWYLPIIIFSPLLLLIFNSLIIVLTVQTLLKTNTLLAPVIFFILDWIPLLMGWVALSLVYIFLPNTKVSWKAGFLAGFITTILYLIWQRIYVTFQVNAASYGAIYGTFAAIPLFLIWLNYSWLIILFGTELTYQLEKEIS